MFVQVIEGKVRDAKGVRTQLDRWSTDLKPGAIGFLGSTGGIAEDGTMIAVVRFADADAAAKNGARPEQTAWWNEMMTFVDGTPTVRESTDTSILFEGGSDTAGFVQVMIGKVSDRTKAEVLETPELLEQLRKARPDLLGGQRVWFDGGEYVEVAYFSSEGDARTGETSPDFEAPHVDFEAVFGQPRYIDLRDPIFE